MAAVSSRETRVDNRISVETPEAVEFDLDLAGVAPRAGAWAIDWMLKAAIVTVVAIVVGVIGDLAMSVVLLTMFGATWLYHPLFEVWQDGQTPGKKALSIRVVNRDGTPVGWYGAIVRNLVRVADAAPFGYVTGVVAMIVGGRFQRLGDLAGDTVVVYHRVSPGTLDAGRLPEAEPVQVPVVLHPHEQEAIVDYAERSPQLGRARSAELAGILGSMFDVADRDEAMVHLQGLAQRIVRWG